MSWKMDASLLHGLVAILICQHCKSQDGVTVAPLVAELNDPEAIMMPGQEAAELTAQRGENVTEGADRDTEASQPTEPGEKGDTYVPLMSRGSEVIALHEGSNVGAGGTGEGSNDLSGINTSLITDSTEVAQTEVTEDTGEASNKRKFAEAEHDVTDLESWRIGAISVVASLSLGVVIAIYCLKFRNKTRRPEVPVKKGEDNEAGKTIQGESNENTATAGNSQMIKNVSNGSLDLTTTEQEANLSGISVHSPTEAVSSQDLSSDFRNTVI